MTTPGETAAESSQAIVATRDPIVVLGAGPAGLACAYRILLSNPDQKVVVVDRSSIIGGAGASFKWKGHTLDFGPHAFHTRGSEPEKLVRDLFAAEPGLLIEGRKQVHVYLKGKRFKYPLQITEALLKFNPLLSARIIIEFLITSLFHAAVSIPVENFENWGKKRFGPTLYKMSFGDYTEKVWKTKANKISEKFASEKIQGFSFINLIQKLLRVGGQVTEPYYQTWLYHRYGSGQMYVRLGERIRERGGEILLGTTIHSVNRQGRRVVSITVEKDGAKTEIPCTWLVNTIPLPQFVGTLGGDVPFPVRHAASKLRYISLLLVYLEFPVERVSEDHWFYLLDPRFAFNRVTEQKNLSSDTMEPGKTVLSFELTCRVGDEYWRMTDEELVKLAIKDCQSIHFMCDLIGRITDSKVIRVPNVYEIYFKGFDQHAESVLAYMSEMDNVSSVGRRGLFLQGDQHQAVEMGLEMGDILAQNVPDRLRLDGFMAKYVGYLDSY
ncbi:MAG: FAD-dependent oxidoreductase [Chloroflexi bacterium]|nr:FAD-dependent oxidoreductase [Chloroflexota bacterium]